VSSITALLVIANPSFLHLILATANTPGPPAPVEEDVVP
jgi:hypothetical protein